jgi:hypothetical protein
VSRRLGILAALACASALAAAHAPGTDAAFRSTVLVGANTITADRLGNYFRVTPGDAATGDVDTLSVELGVVRARSVERVFTVTNVAATPVEATLTLSGLPQIASAAFRSSGSSSARLAPGQSSEVTIALSHFAGHGSGTLRLGLAGSSWLYRTYPLRLAAAPEAPATLSATARAGGLVSLSWAASGTIGVGGYEVYRAAGDGSLARVATLPASQTAYDDRATVDGATYGYRVRALAADDPALDSVDSPAATATADATPPPAPAAVALANGGGRGGGYVNSSNRSAIAVAVGLGQPGVAGDTVTVTVSAGGPGVSRSVAVPAGATAVTVGGLDLSQLPDGQLTLSATVADAAGNASPASSGQATKDTAAPSAPLAAYFDEKKDDADRIAGLAEPGATVTAVQTEGGSGGPYSATAGQSGVFVVTVAASSHDGVSYDVTATDAAGNTSATTVVSEDRTK